MSRQPARDTSLVEVLGARAEQAPDRKIFTFLADGEDQEIALTYLELDQKARSLAALLKTRAAPQDRVLLLFPTGLDFIVSFFAALHAGLVAVPLPPPDPSRPEQTLAQMIHIVRDAQAKLILSDAMIAALAAPILEKSPELRALEWLVTDTSGNHGEAGDSPVPVTPGLLATLIYTSGSTGNPKGVMVSHGNLMGVVSQIARSFQWEEGTRNVSWLPFYHNFGLVTTVLEPVFSGNPVTFMSPLAFLQRPFRWFRALSRHRGTVSGGTNFAFELCLRQVEARETGELDLSAWKYAVCGAERINPKMVAQLVEKFGPCGLRASSFFPGYGLSESTSVVAVRRKTTPPPRLALSLKDLAKNRVADPQNPTEDAIEVVGCGPAVPGQEIFIVHPDSLRLCSPREVGEIWVRGPSVALGYWNRPSETAETFQAHLKSGEGPFLRTGDLGFMTSGGELYVTGRLKEIIIIRGQNHYPDDLERTVEALHPGLRRGFGAAFAVDDEGEEKLAIAYEWEGEEAPEMNWADLTEAVRGGVSRNHGIQVHAVTLVAPGSVPKTRLGKIQRNACRTAYLQRSWQVLKEWRESPSPAPRNAAPAAPAPGSVQEIDAWWLSQVSRITGRAAEEIDLNRPLAAYGLDSLRSVELARRIETDLGVPCLVSSLFEAADQASLLREFKSQFPGKSASNRKKPWALDLPAEAELDPAISFPAAGPQPRAPGRILLTGATGFLGAFLLQELLEKTDAEVLCLARASGEEEGLQRIRENLKYFGLWEDSRSDRIRAVCGDLSRPRLGLAEDGFRRLGEEVDAIYHNGAAVNFIYSYRDLKPSNVLGTQEIIRLAAVGRLKPLHYVSTLSVFPTAGRREAAPFVEEDDLGRHQGLLNGYAQSKWVAEKLLWQAKSRGLPLTVYRVGEVLGHSVTGACRPTQDAYSILMKGCIEMKSAPQMKLMLYFVPVDYVAKAVVYLSGRTASLGRAFHLTNPVAISTEELFEMMRGLGFPLGWVSFAEWVERIEESPVAGGKNLLKSFLPFLRSETVSALSEASTLLRIDCATTQQALAGSGIRCPPPGEELFQPYLSFLQRSGFLG